MIWNRSHIGLTLILTEHYQIITFHFPEIFLKVTIVQSNFSELGENICNHSLIAKHQVTKSIIWKCPLITERSCCKTLSNLYVIFSWFLWFDEILESLDLKTFLMIVIWLMVFYEYLEEKNVMKMQKWFQLIVGHPVIIICTGGSSRRHSLDTLC